MIMPTGLLSLELSETAWCRNHDLGAKHDPPRLQHGRNIEVMGTLNFGWLKNDEGTIFTAVRVE